MSEFLVTELTINMDRAGFKTSKFEMAIEPTFHSIVKIIDPALSLKRTAMLTKPYVGISVLIDLNKYPATEFLRSSEVTFEDTRSLYKITIGVTNINVDDVENDGKSALLVVTGQIMHIDFGL